jgi:NADPH:quinone reductase-like Zn-dependent oxidoreductase
LVTRTYSSSVRNTKTFELCTADTCPVHAASLNYRDLIITKGLYPFGVSDNVVPASDGAGTVEAVGSKVTKFQKGDKVLTLFNQGHLSGSLDGESLNGGVGGVVDGTLREYGAYNELGLVAMPSSLNFLVLTEGTGGVSIFAVQFAKAAGARVIATTSSNDKADRLKKLGADHVINYKEDTNWGETAKKLTGGLGVQHAVEVGGPTTMKQVLKAIAIDGVISIIGFLGGGKSDDAPGFLDCLMNICTVRGVLVGSRAQFQDMNRAIEANGIKPVVDEKVFKMEDTKDAYQYMWDQKHFGKLCISIA